MKHILQLAVWMLILALSAGVPATAMTVAEITASAKNATAERFPDADSVLVYDLEEITYQPDGLGTGTDDFYQKVLNESGRKQLRELSFRYNSTYEKLEVLTVEIIRPDGKIAKIDPASGRETIDASQMGSNIYDPANKVFTIAVPGLEIGDMLHVKSRETTLKARIPGQWSGYNVLQADVPFLYYEVRINAPESRPLAAKAIKDEVPGTVSFQEKRENGRILYTWIARNVPQVIPEPGMPPMYTTVQRLLTSTAKDWKEISRWYYQVSRPRLDAVTPAIRAKTAELIRNCRTPEEKIMALFQFVSQQVRYMGITAESEAPGYEPHDVSMTFDRRYGVCRDKAALLVSMLELAGFKAFPVLFLAGDPKDDEVPNNYFNHAITAVELAPGKYQLMDPTYETTTELLPAAMSNMSYLVAKPEGETLLRSATVPAEANLLRVSTTAVITPAGKLSGESVLRFEGINDQIYRDAFSRWQPDYRRQFFAAQVKRAIPGAELKTLKIFPENIRDMKTPLRAELTFEGQEFLPENPAEFLLQLPLFGSEFGAAGFVLGPVGLEKRKFKLKAYSTCGIDEEFKLAIPASCRLPSVPESETVAAPGILNWQRKLSAGPAMISGRSRFTIDTVEIDPAGYLKLKEALRKIESAEQKLPVARLDYAAVPPALAGQAFPGADSLLLDREISVTLHDAQNYRTVRREKRRILNYAGVKANSELSIPFQPLRETVSIEATVTSPDGKTRKLGKEELNLMDAPGAAAAPRYPAGKVLVASLPGVAPGSVVESVVTTEVKGGPFFSLYSTFAASVPAEQLRLSLTAPEKLDLRISSTPAGIRFQTAAKGAERTRDWNTSSVPGLPREPSMAPAWLFAPTVMISSGSYRNLADSLRGALEKVLAQPRPKTAALAATLKPAGDNQSVLRDFEGTVLRIRDYVARHIRPAGPGLNELPWSSFSNPDVTLAAGYGNSADRAILLAALLKEAGIESHFVAASGIGYAPQTVRMLERYPSDCFGTLLVYLPALESYLNDTSQYARIGTTAEEEKIGLELSTGRLIPIRPRRKTATSEKLEYNIRIRPDGAAEILATRRTFGVDYENEHRMFREMTPEAMAQYLQNFAAGFSQSAKIVGKPKIDFDNYPGLFSCRVEVPDFASISGPYLQFRLPGYSRFAAMVSTAESERRTPAWRNNPSRLSIEYQIELPPGYEVVPDRPERFELGRFGSAAFYEYFEPARGTLRIDCGLTLPVELTMPDDYGKLVRLQRELGKLSAERVILVNRAAATEKQQ